MEKQNGGNTQPIGNSVIHVSSMRIHSFQMVFVEPYLIPFDNDIDYNSIIRVSLTSQMFHSNPTTVM